MPTHGQTESMLRGHDLFRFKLTEYGLNVGQEVKPIIMNVGLI